VVTGHIQTYVQPTHLSINIKNIIPLHLSNVSVHHHIKNSIINRDR